MNQPGHLATLFLAYLMSQPDRAIYISKDDIRAVATTSPGPGQDWAIVIDPDGAGYTLKATPVDCAPDALKQA